MSNLLKQSTSVTLRFGPFLDSTDGVTPETALTISQADVRLSKAGAAFAQKNDTGSATHDENGWYYLTLNTTDTGTLGLLTVAIYESGALPVWRDFLVVPAAVYDSLVSGTDVMPADVTQWTGTNVATPDTAGYPKVTVKSGTGTGEISLTSGVAQANAVQISGDSAAADNAEAFFDGTGYAGTNNVIPTVTAVTNGVTLAASAVQAIWDALTSALTTVGSIGKLLVDNINATISSRLASASYTAPLDAAGTRTALGLASANLDTQLGTIDTNVDSILADTGTDGVVLSTATRQAIADELLKRNVSNVESAAGEHTLTTIVLAILESSISASTWTIKRTDGSTTHATKTVTTNASADPITGVS